MRTRAQITQDLNGFQNLQLLQNGRTVANHLRTGLRGLSAYKGDRNGKTGRVTIKTRAGSEFSAIDIGFGDLALGKRIPSTVRDGGTIWADY
jgi:hypothetical protein